MNEITSNGQTFTVLKPTPVLSASVFNKEPWRRLKPVGSPTRLRTVTNAHRTELV